MYHNEDTCINSNDKTSNIHMNYGEAYCFLFLVNKFREPCSSYYSDVPVFVT